MPRYVPRNNDNLTTAANALGTLTYSYTALDQVQAATDVWGKALTVRYNSAQNATTGQGVTMARSRMIMVTETGGERGYRIGWKTNSRSSAVTILNSLNLRGA